MFYSTILLAASAFTGLVAAQTSIDPNSVSSTDRLNWCRAETNTCPMLCGGSYSKNTCDNTNLNYTCTCNDGSTPDLSAYVNTIPFYVCQTWVGQCLSNNAGNATAQEACQQVQCGSSTASAVVAAKTSSAARSSSSGGAAAATTSDSGSSAAVATSASASGSAAATGAAGALKVGQEYGTTVLAAGVFGLLAYAL